jgi:mediator of RNA polymerase II transcription subunit 25
MVVCPADHGLQADIIFVIEGTAVNGAYINDLKTNYIIPSLEYFSQGNIDENNYLSEGVNCYYGIVVYQAADCLPHPSSDTIGPFVSPNKLLSAIERLELIGGKGESHANIAEGLATTLQCFEELQQKRDNNVGVQRHCILVCNSPPYSLPVFETHAYTGKTSEQLATILQEVISRLQRPKINCFVFRRVLICR